jgi:hypothetical protein
MRMQRDKAPAVRPKPEALWARISTDGLPPELRDAFERQDWPGV